MAQIVQKFGCKIACAEFRCISLRGIQRSSWIFPVWPKMTEISLISKKVMNEAEEIVILTTEIIVFTTFLHQLVLYHCAKCVHFSLVINGCPIAAPDKMTDAG